MVIYLSSLDGQDVVMGKDEMAVSQSLRGADELN